MIDRENEPLIGQFRFGGGFQQPFDGLELLGPPAELIEFTFGEGQRALLVKLLQIAPLAAGSVAFERHGGVAPDHDQGVAGDRIQRLDAAVEHDGQGGEGLEVILALVLARAERAGCVKSEDRDD